MIYVLAENAEMAKNFMKEVNGKKPNLRIKDKMWTYVHSDDGIRGRKNLIVILLTGWWKTLSHDTCEILTHQIEQGEMIDATKTYEKILSTKQKYQPIELYDRSKEGPEYMQLTTKKKFKPLFESIDHINQYGAEHFYMGIYSDGSGSTSIHISDLRRIVS